MVRSETCTSHVRVPSHLSASRRKPTQRPPLSPWMGRPSGAARYKSTCPSRGKRTSMSIRNALVVSMVVGVRKAGVGTAATAPVAVRSAVAAAAVTVGGKTETVGGTEVVTVGVNVGETVDEMIAAVTVAVIGDVAATAADDGKRRRRSTATTSTIVRLSIIASTPVIQRQNPEGNVVADEFWNAAEIDAATSLGLQRLWSEVLSLPRIPHA
mmetsp:Transcript_21277/g.40699  ORF Transcript_21277/g.40699 Transcript_21277/m.40699 type:complete len:212 (-) Transcript_21277:63-698(-)